MGDLTIVSGEEHWNKAQCKLVTPCVLADFSMVQAGTLLFPGDKAVAEAAVYEENGEILFYPYLKRPCPYRNDWFDICSAYEFGGFWFSTADKDICNKLVSGFEAAFREYALHANIVSEFIRISPLCDISGLDWKDYTVTQASQHIIIPTKYGMNVLWDELDGTRRTEIRQSQKKGLRIAFSDDVKTFTNIYYKRLDALHSYRFYYFPENYIAQLQDKKIIFIYDDDNTICGTQIWIRDHNILYYFLSADVAEKRSVKPTGFGIYEMVKWACDNNIDYIHLGGGTESLHYYKSLFSPHRVDYFLAKRVVNQAAYDHLVQQHRQANGELENPDYFPLYRLDTTDSHTVANKRRYTATQTLA